MRKIDSYLVNLLCLTATMTSEGRNVFSITRPTTLNIKNDGLLNLTLYDLDLRTAEDNAIYLSFPEENSVMTLTRGMLKQPR